MSRRAWEPPGSPTRAVGGLLGVAGGETWQGIGDGPVTTALVDLCNSYVARRGRGVPVEVAKRHDGVAGPGWLLGVAVVRTNRRQLISDTLELALAAGTPMHALGDCVAYVEMAAALFAGEPVEAAVEAATGQPAPPPRETPPLCGESAADAVAAGVWALGRSSGVADVVPALSAVAPSGVGAAVAGLVGLRDGGGGVPARWHQSLRSSAACLALAPGLVRARSRGTVPPEQVTTTAATPSSSPPTAFRVSCARTRTLVGSGAR